MRIYTKTLQLIGIMSLALSLLVGLSNSFAAHAGSADLSDLGKIEAALSAFECQSPFVSQGSNPASLFPRQILGAFIEHIAPHIPTATDGRTVGGIIHPRENDVFTKIINIYGVAILIARGSNPTPNPGFQTLLGMYQEDLSKLFAAYPSPVVPYSERISRRWMLVANANQIGPVLVTLGIIPAPDRIGVALSGADILKLYKSRIDLQGDLANRALETLLKASLTQFSPLAMSVFGESNELQLALPLYIAGFDAKATDIINEDLKKRRYSINEIREIGKAIVQAAKHPEIARLYTQSLNGGIAVEAVMIAASQKGLGNLGRPQQVEIARTVLQYGNLQSTSRVLEIGFGNAATLTTLQPYLRKGKTVGLEYPGGNRSLIPLPHLSMFEGSILQDSQMTAEIAAQGPYDVIYGVDVFKSGILGKTLAGLSHEAYLNWIFQQLVEGGVFIMLNDRQVPSIFTQAECKKAGLSVVRWETTRTLMPEELALFQSEKNPNVGHMNLYVLRKGEPNIKAFLDRLSPQ